LTHIRYSTVAGQLDLPPGRLLTPRAYAQARRRLAEIPAQSDFRLSLRPLPEGNAQLNVTLLERPLVFDGPWDVGSEGIRALTRREITLDVASPTGNGEVWSAGWRWWEDRPRVSLAVTVPAAGGRPGVWRLDGFWEQQAYAAGLSPVDGIPAQTERSADAPALLFRLARSGFPLRDRCRSTSGSTGGPSLTGGASRHGGRTAWRWRPVQ
jgi:hypothetical protein